MLVNEKISPRQYMIVTALFTIGDGILYVPSWLATEAKQDAWIGALLGMVEGLLLAWLYMTLAKRFPQITITEYSKKLLGKWLGAAAALLYVVYFLTDASLILMEIGDFITTQVMPETPIEAVLILFAVSIVIGTRLGAETISRSSELLFPWFILLFCILIFFLWPQIKIEQIHPVLGGGIKPVVSGNLRFFGNMEEAVILLMLFPFVNQPGKAAKAYTIGLLIGIFILSVLTLMAILVLGDSLTALYGYPSYALAQKISVGDFFERIEAIMAFMWFITVYTKIVICYYAASLGLAGLLGLKSHRILTLPLGIVMYHFALNFVPNKTYFDTFAFLIWTPYTLTYGVFLPLVFLCAAMLRKRSGHS